MAARRQRTAWRMPRIIAVATQAMLALAMVAPAIAGDAPFTRKAESSFTEVTNPDGSATDTVVTSSFMPDMLYDPGRHTYRFLLIEQNARAIIRTGIEGADSHITVTAWDSGKKPYDKRLWTIHSKADVGGKWGEFYRAVKFGCCGAEDAYALYNLLTGRHAFSCTSRIMEVDVPNTDTRRYISYLSTNAASGYTWDRQYPHGIGALTLATHDHIVDRVLFESNNDDLDWTPKLTLTDAKHAKGTNSLTLWSANHHARPDAVGGYTVTLRFAGGLRARIPVRHDRFDLRRAHFPASIRARRLSAPK